MLIARTWIALLLVFSCAVSLCTAAFAQQSEATSDKPVLGQSLRYVNPLSLVTMSDDGSPRGVSIADVTAFRNGDTYYLFVTGGGAYVSTDMVRWEYQPAKFSQGNLPVAPHIFKFNDVYYLSGNSAPLYRSKAVLGPYEVAGPWTMANGEPFSGVSNGRRWTGSFDVAMFVDDGNKPYLYYAGRSTDGIYVVPLDPGEPHKFAAEPTHLFGYNADHVWERYGDRNEYIADSWIEGPWVIKRDGIYYLQYCAPGTQWLTYATGVYTSRNPLGPFKYAPRNPILRKTTGLVTGTGHGSVVQGPEGNWWQFYTIVLANPPGGRRIGMDPVGFDEDGNMFVRGPSDTPQWAPGIVADPVRNGDSGSIPLTVNKSRTLNTQSSFSSQRPGRDAAYATDDSNGTYWQPAADDAQPTLTIDLAPATTFDPEEQFIVDSARIHFLAGVSRAGLLDVPGRPGRRAGRGTTPAETEAGNDSKAHQYKIEVSMNGESFTTVFDKTNNDVAKYVEFEEIRPTTCRFVRLTITGWPHKVGVPLGILEFTVFGKPVEPVKR
jgi:xylan 1,4-beta-xylosidase